MSISSWVTELQSLDYNPVVLFKPQGMEAGGTGLENEDFALVIQTSFQCDNYDETVWDCTYLHGCYTW